MKTKINFLNALIALVANSAFVNAQQSTPPYAAGGNTGAQISYGYYTPATPASAHDTFRIVSWQNKNTILFDSIIGAKTAPTVFMADTAGDTASYYNVLHNVAGVTKKWIKKNPFILNHDQDEVTLKIYGSKKQWSTLKLGANIMAGSLSGDTIHIPIRSSNAGGVKVNLVYEYFFNQWAYVGSSVW